MEKETIDLFMAAFLARLDAIRSVMASNEDLFDSRCQLQESLECIKGVKALMQISDLSDTGQAASLVRK